MPSPVQFNCDAHDTIVNGQYGAVWSMGYAQQICGRIVLFPSNVWQQFFERSAFLWQQETDLPPAELWCACSFLLIGRSYPVLTMVYDIIQVSDPSKDFDVRGCFSLFPSINISDPHLWFHMVEATFQLATPKPISESKTKFNYCHAHLPPEVAAVVRDVIITPDAEDPFKKLKEEIIARCGETKSQEIRRLLSGEQLGDRKPSELLRTMQRRAESHEISDSLLLELFLNQLPQHVQSILAAIPSLSSTRAAEIADKVMEVSTSSEVSEVS
ncbi:uncharacterized protein, partial [Parasteatoda tepidariorum]|uniref:uncharacterized protein n=1 Tax=Parasteatoda tepidariorum TaxID=114398 RepID=UPI0039BCC6FD